MNYQSNDVIQRARDVYMVVVIELKLKVTKKKETREKIPIKLAAETADVARLSTARVCASA